jgi:hypothetical protein
MKTVKTFLYTAATLLLATACSSDEPAVTPVGGDTTVTFAIDVPASIASRARTAYADGTTATRLTYAVYKYDADAKTYTCVSTKSGIDVINLKANVSVNLISGQTYEVAFWVAAKDAPYTFNTTDATISVNYADAESNDEKRDAFFACQEVETDANKTIPVTLTRPFAQLNIGTSDFDAASEDGGFEPAYSYVKVKAYDKFNIITGEATDDATFEYREFATAKRPQGETFPVESGTYEYLAMNYLLMAKDQEVSDVIAVFSDGKGSEKSCTYTNIPLKRNYRTNIYGQLLTTTNNFDVEIVPDYNSTDYDLGPWDGESTAIVIPDENGVIEIKSAPQFARLFMKSNDYYYNEDTDEEYFPQTYAGNTINLDVDVDLANNPIQPISWDDENEAVFKGTLDGQGHTIKNLVVDASYPHAGLFGNTDGATIKNLTIENVTIINAKSPISFTGALAGYAKDSNIENVHVTGKIIVEGVYYTGALVGSLHEGSTMSNCSIDADKDSYVLSRSNAYCGGLVGYYYKATMENVTSNIKVISYGGHVGGLVGFSYTGAVYNKCTSSGDVYLYTQKTSTSEINPYWMTIGGISGGQCSVTAQSFNNSSFTGAIYVYDTDGTEVTDKVKETNSYWKYTGWNDRGTPTGNYMSDTYIKIND